MSGKSLRIDLEPFLNEAGRRPSARFLITLTEADVNRQDLTKIAILLWNA